MNLTPGSGADAHDAAGGTPNRQWRALLIGVDRYPAFPQRQLSGCVNDTLAIRQFLINRVQMPDANIRCLISARQPVASFAAATAANIRAELATMAGLVGSGDHVVLFYAGHGIRVSQQHAGGAFSYYGFAPEDTARDAAGLANLILGSEIHDFLAAIEAGGGTATVIADTCHSGASLRALEEDVRERALPIEPLTPDQWRDFSAHHPALQQRSARGGASEIIGSFGAYAGGDFVMLTGCLDSQTSKEDQVTIVGDNGEPTRVSHGLMTLALLRELESVPPDQVRSLRWMDFHPRLCRTVADRASAIKASAQTVSLEGRREKTVFGGAWRPFAPGFTVRTNSAGTLTINGGTLHGLAVGATLAVHPPDTDDFDRAAAPGIVVTVDAATPMTCTAHPNGAIVADHSRARLARPAPGAPPISARLVAGNEPMPERMREALRDTSGPASGFVMTESTADPAHVEIRRWQGEVPEGVWPEPGVWRGARDGWIVVRADDRGAPTLAVSGLITPNDIVAYLPGAGAALEAIPPRMRDGVLGTALARGLSSYARYLQKRDQRAVDTTLASMLNVVLRAGEGGDPPGPFDAQALMPIEPDDGGVYHLTEAHWIWVEIRVRCSTDLRLQVGWVMFSDDGNVVPLWPPEGSQPTFADGSVTVVGFDRQSALSLTRRPDQQASLYTLAVVAATGPKDAPPLNIGALAQDSVQAELAAEIAAACGMAHRGEPLRRPAAREQPAWYRWNLRIAITAMEK